MLWMKILNKHTCNVCVAASEYCRIRTGVTTGCFICSVSMWAVDDCCLSRLGDGILIRGGDDGDEGRIVGISIGIEGTAERTGDIFVWFVIYSTNYANYVSILIY